MRAVIAVAGSLNLDLVIRVPQLPSPGQTVLGSSFRMIPGGKGGNQACAAAKLAGKGIEVRLAGRVGSDAFGDQLKTSLREAGVNVAGVQVSQSETTGVASILVDERGQNTIAVAPGANSMLTADSARRAMRGAVVAMFQLETPFDDVRELMRAARADGAVTILDPAPARWLDRDFLEQTDILTPNETETAILLGESPSVTIAEERIAAAAQRLRELGARNVVLKLGPAGCFYLGDYGIWRVPGFQVDAVDTTAAGDVFNGALAVAVAEAGGLSTLDWVVALRFANAAAAISVTRAGAQSSVPLRAEVDEFVTRKTA